MNVSKRYKETKSERLERLRMKKAVMSRCIDQDDKYSRKIKHKKNSITNGEINTN